MCGRYASFRDAQDLADYFALREIDEDAEAWQPSWNVAPTQDVRIITADADGTRHLRLARWGLVPSWAKDPSVGNRMINARAETAATKPAFRAALAKRRCGIPADAYYEWQRDGKHKTPFAIGLEDGGPFAFAGLYEFWRPRETPGAGWLASCTILTTAARGKMAGLHDREPVILTRAALDDWLAAGPGAGAGSRAGAGAGAGADDGGSMGTGHAGRADAHEGTTGPSGAAEALAIALDGMEPVSRLSFYPVSAAVGSVASNGPQLLDRDSR